MCTRSSSGGLTHGGCRRKYGLDGLTAIFDYKDAGVRKVIEEMKFGFNQELIPLMLAGFVRPLSWGSQVILVPVPLHRYRYNWRGFNQAEEIAKLAGEVINGLDRVRATAQQASIENKQARFENLQGCFAVKKEMAETVEGKEVILVDDVFTSGATMRECARVLKEIGAKRVWGLVLAR